MKFTINNWIHFLNLGQILAEGSPERLMEYYDADTLENVFYKLCLNQKQRKTTVQQAHPTRRRSIIRTESIKSGAHRLSLKRNSEINLNKNIQELTPKTKPKMFARQGSFTSSVSLDYFFFYYLNNLLVIHFLTIFFFRFFL